MLQEKSLIIANLFLCLALTACGGGSGDQPIKTTTQTPPSVPTPTKNTEQWLLEGDIYSLRVGYAGSEITGITNPNELGSTSVLKTSVKEKDKEQLLISDDASKGDSPTQTPEFLRTILSPDVSFTDMDLSHRELREIQYLGTRAIGNLYANNKTSPEWLTHIDRYHDGFPTYRFRLEEFDLTGKLMKDSLYFSTGASKNGLLPSGAKLVDSLSDVKFSNGAKGLRTHVVLPANMLLSGTKFRTEFNAKEALLCIRDQINGPVGVGLKLTSDEKVEVYNLESGKCAVMGPARGEGKVEVSVYDAHCGLDSQTTYFFDFPSAIKVEDQFLNPTYLNAGAKLAVSTKFDPQGKGIIGGVGAYFKKETELVDPQIHFNKAAISELKTQFGLP
ncbi:hypothetical protein ACUHMQ_20515 [Chitinimonas sp. PSY-7]|uniref:hypothetical protein n=1 Tax=Chitinimonas sp. PSY-7 TaxID=3459088 RepID=UPI0040400999